MLPLEPRAAVNEFVRFAAMFNLADRPIRSKLNHSLRVAYLSWAFAHEVGDVDESLALLAGLTHDVARFPQWAMFGNFIDAQTCDHGELSAELLGKYGYLRCYLLGGADRNSVAPEYGAAPVALDELPAVTQLGLNYVVEAIRWHNKLALPEGVDSPAHRLALLLRDADKCDILHLFAARGLGAPSASIKGEPTEESFSAVAERRTCDRTKTVTEADRAISKACLAFGLETELGRAYVRDGSFVAAYLDGLTFESREAAGLAREVKQAFGPS